MKQPGPHLDFSTVPENVVHFCQDGKWHILPILLPEKFFGPQLSAGTSTLAKVNGASAIPRLALYQLQLGHITAA